MNTITIGTVSLPTLTYRDIPIITTERLAVLYDTQQDRIRKNFNRNAERFIEGKHYFKLTGAELRDFVQVFKTDTNASRIRNLILWTERGAARHAKMLETEKAWEVFELLEDAYFTHAPKQQEPDTLAALVHFNGGSNGVGGLRFLIAFNDEGTSYTAKPIPRDCFVMTHAQFLQTFNDPGYPISTDTLLELIASSVKRLQSRLALN